MRARPLEQRRGPRDSAFAQSARAGPVRALRVRPARVPASSARSLAGRRSAWPAGWLAGQAREHESAIGEKRARANGARVENEVPTIVVVVVANSQQQQQQQEGSHAGRGCRMKDRRCEPRARTRQVDPPTGCQVEAPTLARPSCVCVDATSWLKHTLVAAAGLTGTARSQLNCSPSRVRPNHRGGSRRFLGSC